MRTTGTLAMLLLCACAAKRPMPAVTSAADVETRWSPSGQARVDIYASGGNAFLARLTMAPGAEVPEHRDPTEEYIHVIEGSATMVIDGWRYEVGPGDTVLMPAGAVVSVENGDAEMAAFQVFAGPESAKKYDSWLPEKPE